MGEFEQPCVEARLASANTPQRKALFIELGFVEVATRHAPRTLALMLSSTTLFAHIRAARIKAHIFHAERIAFPVFFAVSSSILR